MRVLHDRERAALELHDGTKTVPASEATCSALAAGSEAAKYGIQYDGTSAGTMSGTSMQPATDALPCVNSV